MAGKALGIKSGVVLKPTTANLTITRDPLDPTKDLKSVTLNFSVILYTNDPIGGTPINDVYEFLQNIAGGYDPTPTPVPPLKEGYLGFVNLAAATLSLDSPKVTASYESTDKVTFDLSFSAKGTKISYGQ